MATSTILKNYYQLLDLPSTERNHKGIELRIVEKEKSWRDSRTYGNAAEQKFAKDALDLLKDIRDVMLKDCARRREMSKEWQAIEQERLAELTELYLSYKTTGIRRTVGKPDEYYELLPKPDYLHLVKKFSQREVESVVKVPIEEHSGEDQGIKLSPADLMDRREYVTLAELFRAASLSDIYQLLERPQGADLESLSKRTDELLHAYGKKPKTPANDIIINILRRFLTIFKSEAQRRQYDNSLAWEAVASAIYDDALGQLKSRGRIEPQIYGQFVRNAEKKGVPRLKTEAYLQWMIRHFTPKDGGPKPRKCPHCKQENEPQAIECTSCRKVMQLNCPRCKTVELLHNAACTKCQLTDRDAQDFRTKLKEAWNRLNQDQFADARRLLEQARKLVENSDDAHLLAEKIDEQEFQNVVHQAKVALGDCRFDDAEQLLGDAGQLSPNHPDLAELRDQVEHARAFKANLKELNQAIRDNKDERRILKAWQALSGQLNADAYQPQRDRADLAERRVKALDLAQSGQTFAGDQMFAREFVKLEPLLKLSTCEDPAVSKLRDLRLQVDRRIQRVNELSSLLKDISEGTVNESQIAFFSKELQEEYYPLLWNRVQLSVQLTAKAPDQGLIADHWNFIQGSEFCLIHEEQRKDCETIAQTEASRRALQRLKTGECEDDDIAFVQAYRHYRKNRSEADSKLGRRYQQAVDRIEALKTLRSVVEQADAGQLGNDSVQAEASICRSADEADLPAGYAYKLSERVEIAQAMSAQPWSDRKVAAAARRCTDAENRPRWPETLDKLKQSERFAAILDRLDEKPNRGDREVVDRFLIDHWDPVLKESEDADAQQYLDEWNEAQERQRNWQRIEGLLQRGGDPRGATDLRKTVAEYRCCRDRKQDLDALEEQERCVTKILDALESNDSDVFAQEFSPALLRQHQRAFRDYWPRIDTFLKSSPAAPFQVKLSGAGWHWDREHDRRHICLQCQIDPPHAANLLGIAASKRQHFNSWNDLDARVIYVDAKDATRQQEIAPKAGEELFITVWPVLEIGEIKLFGTPARLGPITLQSHPAGAGTPPAQLKNASAGSPWKRIACWLTDFAKRI